MEEEDWVAIQDIHPQAPVHVLIIPKKHLVDLNVAEKEDENLLGKLLLAASQVAKQLKLDKGFRLIINQGQDGGQMVPHLHIHFLGGKVLGPKMIRD